jgi:hypothetical protein
MLLRLEDATPVYQELMRDYEDHLPVHAAYLHSLDADKVCLYCIGSIALCFLFCLQDRLQRLIEVIAAAKMVIQKIDVKSLLLFLGLKTDTRSDASTIKA